MLFLAFVKGGDDGGMKLGTGKGGGIDDGMDWGWVMFMIEGRLGWEGRRYRRWFIGECIAGDEAGEN